MLEVLKKHNWSQSADPVKQRRRAMASQRELVMLDGRLNGMGRELACTISALRLSLTEATKRSLTDNTISRSKDEQFPSSDGTGHGWGCD